MVVAQALVDGGDGHLPQPAGDALLWASITGQVRWRMERSTGAGNQPSTSAAHSWGERTGPPGEIPPPGPGRCTCAPSWGPSQATSTAPHPPPRMPVLEQLHKRQSP